MSVYRYGDASPIREVVFNFTKDRPPMALLLAAQGASQEQLSSIRTAMDGAGWQSTPAYADGKAVLQVSGFKQASELNELLQARHFTQGQAAILNQPGDHAKLGRWDRVRNISLKLAGAFNMIGTTGGFLAGGISKKDSYLKTAGALYLLSEANLIRYGNAKPEHYTREITEDLGDFIRKQGDLLPAGSNLADIAQHKKSGLLTTLNNILYSHPAQERWG